MSLCDVPKCSAAALGPCKSRADFDFKEGNWKFWKTRKNEEEKRRQVKQTEPSREPQITSSSLNKHSRLNSMTMKFAAASPHPTHLSLSLFLFLTHPSQPASQPRSTHSSFSLSGSFVCNNKSKKTHVIHQSAEWCMTDFERPDSLAFYDSISPFQLRDKNEREQKLLSMSATLCVVRGMRLNRIQVSIIFHLYCYCLSILFLSLSC